MSSSTTVEHLGYFRILCIVQNDDSPRFEAWACFEPRMCETPTAYQPTGCPLRLKRRGPAYNIDICAHFFTCLLLLLVVRVFFLHFEGEWRKGRERQMKSAIGSSGHPVPGGQVDDAGSQSYQTDTRFPHNQSICLIL